MDHTVPSYQIRSRDPRPSSSRTSSQSSPFTRPTTQRRTTAHSRSQTSITKRPDLLSFHQQSCQLFSSLDSTAATPQLPSTTSTPRHHSLVDLQDTHTVYSPISPFHREPNARNHSLLSTTSASPSSLSSSSTSTASSASTATISTPFPTLQARPHLPPKSYPDSFISHTTSPSLNENFVSSSPFAATTLHWTTPSTRAAEYAKIDAAHSGFRGFAKRITPKCWTSCPRRKFYRDQDEDDSDAESVRRIRVDSEKDGWDEKGGEVEKTVPEKPVVQRGRRWFC